MVTAASRSLSCLLLLAWLAGGESFASEPAPARASPEDDSPPLFVAPFFLSARFTREVQLQIERLRIEQERETMVYREFKRGLMWAARDNGQDIDWKRANRYCDELELAGYDDWRLPAIEELERLQQKMSQALFKTPAEVRLTACCPWSSTKRGDRSAWNFSFRFRKRFSGTLSYSYDLRALCVRRMAAEEMAVSKKGKKAAKRALRSGRGDLGQDG